ncbi:MAG: ribonuclease E/G, partial [Lachnospiraceae bacterium]|nr:ribonuclease E/G [Lachnospiraceae bacterium]
MSKRIVITKENIRDNKHLVTALFSDNKLAEVSCENIKKESILGNIYVGKVSRIVEKINAAFVEIAPGQRTYLSLA